MNEFFEYDGPVNIILRGERIFYAHLRLSRRFSAPKVGETHSNGPYEYGGERWIMGNVRSNPAMFLNAYANNTVLTLELVQGAEKGKRLDFMVKPDGSIEHVGDFYDK